MIAEWRSMATLLFERWKWRPTDVEALSASDFLQWYEACLAIVEAEIEALGGR